MNDPWYVRLTFRVLMPFSLVVIPPMMWLFCYQCWTDPIMASFRIMTPMMFITSILLCGIIYSMATGKVVP